MKRKHQRLLFILLCVSLLSISAALIFSALRENMLYFYMPHDLETVTLKPEQKIRLGGLVKEDSIQRHENQQISFIVTDGKSEILVYYQGGLPDLFREGQGVVAEGTLHRKTFAATRILAKHDERYMPPEVAKELKKQGVYRQP